MEQAKRKYAIEALRRLVLAVVEVVEESGPEGAPEGPMYLAMQHEIGLGLTEFQKLVDVAVDIGKVRRGHGHVLVATKFTKAAVA